MISAPGIGSGLDINSIVTQLVAAEGDTKTVLLASRRSDAESDISAYGLLKSVLSSFQSSISSLKNSSDFEKRTATSGDSDLFTATATGTIATGVYDIEVKTLAEAHKLMTTAFTDSSTVVGTGTLAISVGSDTFSITIDSSNNTVTGIRDAINDASNNTGVSASIINVDGGTKLVLSSDDTGADNALTVTVVDDDGMHKDDSGLSQLYYDTSDADAEQLTQINGAVDSVVEIDGQTVTSSSNTVVDAIQGVTLNLLKVEAIPTTTTPLTISLDKDSVSSAVNSFISSYNNLIASMNELSGYDADTGAAGILLGDTTLRTVLGQIRREMNSTVTGITGALTNLVEIGITTTSTGTLELDSTTLDSVLSSNFDDMDDLFASTNGIATRLDAILDDYVKFDGILDTKVSGLNKTIDNIDDDLISLNDSLLKLETRLYAQYGALDGLLSVLQATGSFLEQQFELQKNFFIK